MSVIFILTVILVALVWVILMSIIIYRRLYLRNLSYVQHIDVEKELELPPLGKEWDYDEETIQNNDNILIDVTV